MFALLPLSSGLFMGWALGGNASANVFGAAVATRVVSFRTAGALFSACVIVGAVLQGRAGIETYRELSEQDLTSVVIASLSAALCMATMTLRGIPVSGSQVIVGAICGVGLVSAHVDLSILVRILICWVCAPVGAFFLALIIHRILLVVLTRIPMSILTRDQLLFSGLVVMGCYGSYALGANNVANVTGVFSGHLQGIGIGDLELAVVGSVAIAFGGITFSKRVMQTVGARIMKLDGLTALVSVTACALTTHFFAVVGVPVSTSQAIVGAICGSALVSSGTGLHLDQLSRIFVGWFVTPIVALILSSSLYAVHQGILLAQAAPPLKLP